MQRTGKVLRFYLDSPTGVAIQVSYLSEDGGGETLTEPNRNWLKEAVAMEHSWVLCGSF